MDTRRLLDPQSIQRDSDNALYLEQNGNRVSIDGIVRCFPFSSPHVWLSLQNSEGKEIGLLKDLDGLAEEPQSWIRENLKVRYDIPKIHRIVSIEPGAGEVIWHVETDGGTHTFRILGDRGVDNSAFPRVFLIDGLTRKRFEIPDYTALDRPSQVLARNYLRVSGRGPHGSRFVDG